MTIEIHLGFLSSIFAPAAKCHWFDFRFQFCFEPDVFVVIDAHFVLSSRISIPTWKRNGFRRGLLQQLFTAETEPKAKQNN
jgi:hypothetical protein